MKIQQKLMALALALMLICANIPALATSVVYETYSKAPANPTQDNVKEIQAAYKPENQPEVPCSINPMEPTALTVEIIKDIFKFVDVDQQPPAR